MSFKVVDICDINKESLGKNDKLEYINYLDTGNLTLGNIEQIQTLIIGEDKIPSRAKRKVKLNDILISTVRPNQRHYGILKKVEDNMIVSTGFAVLSPNEKIVNPVYLYNYLTQDKITDKLQAIAETSTTAYPSIKPSDIGNLEIDLPPIEEQEAIAKILYDLDDKIEVNNKINKNLEEMAKAIFKHWFVDFEFPNEDGKPYKSSGGEMVDSELGMIPKGWEVDNLGNSKITSLVKTGIDKFDREKIYLATADVENTNIVNNTTKVTYDKRPSRANMQPTEKTIWFAKMKDSRKLMVIDDYSKEIIDNYVLSTGFSGIKCSNESLYYMWCFIMSNEFENLKNNLCNGTTMQAINNENINKIKINIPCKKLLKQFNDLTVNIFKNIYKNNIENEKLSNLRDTLLPKLMSGEIRVPID